MLLLFIWWQGLFTSFRQRCSHLPLSLLSFTSAHLVRDVMHTAQLDSSDPNMSNLYALFAAVARAVGHPWHADAATDWRRPQQGRSHHNQGKDGQFALLTEALTHERAVTHERVVLRVMWHAGGALSTRLLGPVRVAG